MSFHRLKENIGNQILNSFNHECIKCHSKKDLCVHHVIKMSPKDVRYNDPDNLIVLCRSCHMSIHRKNGDIITSGNITGKGGGSKWGRRGKNNPEVICSFIDCEIKQHAQGLCKKHYERERRSGRLKVNK